MGGASETLDVQLKEEIDPIGDFRPEGHGWHS